MNTCMCFVALTSENNLKIKTSLLGFVCKIHVKYFQSNQNLEYGDNIPWKQFTLNTWSDNKNNSGFITRP